MALEAINLSGDDRLNSEVRLSWFGTDRDGFVVGFEISLDNTNWDYTTTQDSTFIFNIPPGQDTVDIDFYVRAIDNNNNTDATPAFIRVPLKNTPPEVEFNNDRGPADTAFIASTFFWNASDPDGDQTVERVFMKFNEGTWTEVDKNQTLISFVVDTGVANGDATASIYYGAQNNAETFTIDGLKVNDQNVLYIKAEDIAGAESQWDTSSTFYLKNKTAGANLLWISAHSPNITQQYRNDLDSLGATITYDLLDYGVNFGINQPKYWNPTFKLVLNLYDKVFINAPSTKFTNSITGQTELLLSFMAPIIQDYTSNGGKSFVTTVFGDPMEDLSLVAGAFPIEGLVVSSGQIRLFTDSALVPSDTVAGYPMLNPNSVLFGFLPIIKSVDSEDFYRAQLTKVQGWQGDNLIATRRSISNELRQVFFALELHNFNGDNASKGERRRLIKTVLIDDL